MFESLLGIFSLGEDTWSVHLGKGGVHLGEGVRLGKGMYA